jgi:hypothetical protein
MAAMLAFPLSLKAEMNMLAAAISAFHPALPRLPLPSRSMMTSSDLLHFNASFLAAFTTHRCLLQGLYSNLSGDQESAHSPSP